MTPATQAEMEAGAEPALRSMSPDLVRKAMGAESHIQNEVDSVCTLLSSTLYKLRRLA